MISANVTIEDILLKDELDSLAKNNENFNVFYTLDSKFDIFIFIIIFHYYFVNLLTYLIAYIFSLQKIGMVEVDLLLRILLEDFALLLLMILRFYYVVHHQ